MSTNTIVVGGGTAGLSAAWRLALAGHRVTVLERFEHIHTHGSHGGHTRAFRHAYHEGSHYVDLVARADARWLELESGREGHLLRRVGLVEFGDPDDPEFAAAREALDHAGQPHHTVSPAQLRARWGFRVPADWVGCMSPRDGYLRVHACLDALRDAARDAGAKLRYGVRVREVDPAGPRVLLEAGDVLAADHVVVTAGAFAQALLPWMRNRDGRHLVRAQRRTLHWRAPRPIDGVDPRALPVWAAFTPEGFFYGFPDADTGPAGLKLACHQTREGDPRMHGAIDPDHDVAPVDDDDRGPIDRFVSRHFPLAGGSEVATGLCKYAATPDHDFLVDHLDPAARVWILGGLSGHGFKFASVLGELVVDAMRGDLDPALTARFAIGERPGWRRGQ